ncbi:MAG: two pore domain potassium channel family protein [Bacteroidetes bacterium]|nr:two pore domain potassium channel family protein [Bacteroidota bacterium]
MLEKLFPYRFELFFISLTTILFGGVFFPSQIFHTIIDPVFFIVNILSGIVMLSKTKKLKRLFLFILVILCYLLYRIHITNGKQDSYEFIRLAIYFVFYVIVIGELIKQVWNAKIVSKNVIIGLMSGYICLGLVCFFIFLTIEMLHPGSFSGINLDDSTIKGSDSLLYYSYITMLSIGYGEITPITVASQKAAILTGLLGQFYLVILTATIVGKYIAQTDKKIEL